MKLKQISRHMHYDFHTMPGIDNLGENWSAAEFARRLKQANVDYVNVFASCNVGFVYYDSKIGIPHPNLDGDRLKEMIRECHLLDIGVTAYINVGYMHEASLGHADWLRVDGNNRIRNDTRFHTNFSRAVCFNSPGYRAHVIGLINEICSYDIDGLFCDCIQPVACHCDYCTKDMVAKGIDTTDEEAVAAFDLEVLLEFCREVKKIVGPARRLYFNGMPAYLCKELNTHIELECLPGGPWGYDYFPAASAYARTIYQDRLYMTGRFQANWGDFGGYKGKASVENDVYDALLNGFAPSVGDHLHPAECGEKDILRDIGEIFRFVKGLQPHLQGRRYVADIALITQCNCLFELSPVYSGAARMLGELKQSFDIVHKDMDFSRYALIILPDNLQVDEVFTARLEAYISGGGKILMSGCSGLTENGSRFSLKAEPAEFDGHDPCTAGYFDFVTPPRNCADMHHSMYSEGILLGNTQEKDLRAIYVEPYFSNHFDGERAYYYTPPRGATNRPAAVCNGTIGRICFNVFTAYKQKLYIPHKLLVAQLLAELLPQPLLCTSLPSYARVSVMADETSAVLQVKLTHPEHRGSCGIVEEHTSHPAGATVRVKGHYSKITSLCGGDSTICQVGDYTVVILPQMCGYYAALLEAPET